MAWDVSLRSRKIDIPEITASRLKIVITDLHNPEIYGFHRVYVYTNGEFKFPLSLFFFLNLNTPLNVLFYLNFRFKEGVHEDQK